MGGGSGRDGTIKKYSRERNCYRLSKPCNLVELCRDGDERRIHKTRKERMGACNRSITKNRSALVQVRVDGRDPAQL